MKGRPIIFMSLLLLVAGVLSINLAFAQAAEKPDIILPVADDTDEDVFDAVASQQSAPITLVIAEVVEPNRIQDYEDWQKVSTK
jgi:hypothetical protein